MHITKPKLVAGGIGFGEGPLWHKDGFLLFSDVKKNRIMKLKDGMIEVFLNESGWQGLASEDNSDQPGSNALAYDLEGNIVFCQHGNHAIAKLEENGRIRTLVNSYRGTRLNSPNDLCVGPDGSIYFSDPPYGLRGKSLRPDIAQPQAGVYRWFNNELELLTDEFRYPNGVCFSPDRRYLYIGSNDPEEKRIRRYELIDGQLHNGQTFLEENADGIKTDENGNLYMATMKGMKIFSAEGELLEFIDMGQMVTNLCFHGNELYMTTETKIYRCEIER